MIRLARELVRAMLQASDRYVVAAQRLRSLKAPRPPHYPGCPDDPICRHCPSRMDDDVCLPDERRVYELVLRYPSRNGRA